MAQSKRIETLCALLQKARVFADIGCDHGYCTEYMLKNDLCERAIFSDISKGSLLKAEKLLGGYVKAGKATPVLGDGFFGVPKDTDEVLIAGMGGAEIVSILSDKKYGFMPKRFVLQPMHDTELVRRYLLENGGYIERDFTFEDTKFYDCIVGGKADETHQTRPYTDEEYEFGRENLQTLPTAFVTRTEKLVKNIDKYITATLSEQSRAELIERQKRLQGALKGANSRIL